MNRTKNYWSKNNPRPRPVGYKVDASRKTFPPYLFDRTKAPIYEAMEEFYQRRHRYPSGITPIYENVNERKEEQ